MRALAVVMTFVATLLTASGANADVARGLIMFERGEFSRAVAELLPDARGGDPRAQYVVGVILLNDLAEPSAPNEDAAYWITKAAEQNYVQAQTELARMYRAGDHVEQDFAKMVHWYERAAEEGDVGAQLFVADAYAYGQGVEIDLVAAYMWYDIALEYWGPLAVRARDLVAEQMTPEQIAEAERRANRWLAERERKAQAQEEKQN
ncbi:MAG: tetratricopeptide repeat protein [Parvularculaceae bacterium]